MVICVGLSGKTATRKLMSKEFLVWDKPRIVAKTRLLRDGGLGREVSDLGEVLALKEDTPKYPPVRKAITRQMA